MCCLRLRDRVVDSCVGRYCGCCLRLWSRMRLSSNSCFSRNCLECWLLSLFSFSTQPLRYIATLHWILYFPHSPCDILRHYIKYYIFHTAPALYCDITLNIIFSTQPLCYIVTLHYLLSRHKTKDEFQFWNLRLKHIFHLFICASHKLQFWQCTEKIEEVCTKRLPNQLSTGLRRLQSSRPTAPTACDEKLISIHKY